MNWKPIDTMPCQSAGLITDGKVITVARIVRENGSFYFSCHGFGGWEWEYDFSPGQVTHWMPLPEFPKP